MSEPLAPCADDVAVFTTSHAVFTRQDVVDGLRETLEQATAAQKRTDPSFVRWPDLEFMIEHLAEHGLPPRL